MNVPNLFFILQNMSFSYCLSRPNSSPTSFKPTSYILWGQGSCLNQLCILFWQRHQLWLGTKEMWNEGKEGKKQGREGEGGRKEERKNKRMYKTRCWLNSSPFGILWDISEPYLAIKKWPCIFRSSVMAFLLQWDFKYHKKVKISSLKICAWILLFWRISLGGILLIPSHVGTGWDLRTVNNVWWCKVGPQDGLLGFLNLQTYQSVLSVCA